MISAIFELHNLHDYLSLRSVLLQAIISVYGCSDVNIPEGAWYKRDGDTAVVGCEKDDLTWPLHCEGTEWKGTVGSCPVESKSPHFPPPYVKCKFKND